jgi:SAM-dependent methyltransferase
VRVVAGRPLITFEHGDRPCPVCGSTEGRVFVEARFEPSELDAMSFSSRKIPDGLFHRLIECDGCDLLYASPVPTFESLTDAYRTAGYESGEEARYAAATYVGVVETIAPKLPDLRGAADIGAGDGAFIERLRDVGFVETVGFEPSEAPRAAARPSVQASIRPEPFSSGVLPAESFTLISCMQTIEHVLDPLEICRDATRALAPNGALLIACHDRRALTARVLKQRSPIFDIEHVQLFSPRSMRALLGSAGLERVDVRPLRNRYPLRYWLQLAPLPKSVKAPLRRLLSTGRLIDRPVSLGVGNLVAVGYKPA